MNLRQIHHVAIIVSDYKKSRKFYVETLGFQIIRENYRPSEACGLRHLAFRVDDVDAAIAELREKGIETEPVRVDEFTGKRMTFFQDPDGLPLELHE